MDELGIVVLSLYPSFSNILSSLSYERTPIMSTYLLAFIVGEFDCVEGQSKDGVLVRVYTPLGKKEQVCHVTPPVLAR